VKPLLEGLETRDLKTANVVMVHAAAVVPTPAAHVVAVAPQGAGKATAHAAHAASPTHASHHTLVVGHGTTAVARPTTTPGKGSKIPDKPTVPTLVATKAGQLSNPGNTQTDDSSEGCGNILISPPPPPRGAGLSGGAATHPDLNRAVATVEQQVESRIAGYGSDDHGDCVEVLGGLGLAWGLYLGGPLGAAALGATGTLGGTMFCPHDPQGNDHSDCVKEDGAIGALGGAALGSEPGAIIGGVAGTVFGVLSCPNDPQGGAGGANPGSTPGADPGSTPGADPGSTPGADPGSTPGADPGSTPGADPGSTPGGNGDNNNGNGGNGDSNNKNGDNDNTCDPDHPDDFPAPDDPHGFVGITVYSGGLSQGTQAGTIGGQAAHAGQQVAMP
jgi:hypothetical protein